MDENINWPYIPTSQDLVALGFDEASAELASFLYRKDLEELDSDHEIRSITLPPCIPSRASARDAASAGSKSRSQAQNCIVCMVEDVHVRLACGHASLCGDCSEVMQNSDAGMKCPLCRSRSSVFDRGAHVNLQPSFIKQSHLTSCDGCMNAQSSGARFVCQLCAQVQLCSQCHDSFTFEPSSGALKGRHKFIRTILPFSDPRHGLFAGMPSGHPFLTQSFSLFSMLRFDRPMFIPRDAEDMDEDDSSWGQLSSEHVSTGRPTPFTCVYCERVFSESDYSSARAAGMARDQHERDAHEGRQSCFSCGVCGRRFNESNYDSAAVAQRACLQHQNAHRRVLCQVCAAEFDERDFGGARGARSACARHEEAVHGRIFACQHCERRFAERDYARAGAAERACAQHERDAHGGGGDEEDQGCFTCEYCSRAFFESDYAAPGVARRACEQHTRNVHMRSI